MDGKFDIDDKLSKRQRGVVEIKAPPNSSKPIKLSKPATATSATRSQTREAFGTPVIVTAGVKLGEFDDISTSSALCRSAPSICWLSQTKCHSKARSLDATAAHRFLSSGREFSQAQSDADPAHPCEDKINTEEDTENVEPRDRPMEKDDDS